LKIQIFDSLSLRHKFVLIALLGMLLVAVTMGMADKFIGSENEARINAERISVQQALWQRISKDQFEQLGLGTSSLRRSQVITRALSDRDIGTLQERADTLYSQLLGSDVLDHLQITNSAGEVKYRTDGIQDDSKSQMQVVRNSLATKQLVNDIEIGRDGKLYALVAFPLFSKGELVGTGIFIKNLQGALETFAKDNQLDAAILKHDGQLQYSTNAELYGSFNINLPAPGESTVDKQHVEGRHYNLIVQPILNNQSEPIANLVTTRDITEGYMAQRKTQWIVYTIVALGMLVTAGLLLYYIFHSLKPLDILLRAVQKLHQGDINARAEVTQDNEIGKLGNAFNSMADQMVNTLNRETIAKEDLEGRIEILLTTVDAVSHGDLSTEVMAFSGDESVDHLAKGIQLMIDNLNTLVSQVQQSGIQVTSSATEIAATAKQQEATVTEQAASTNEIMATATQISATSRELASTMHEVADVADKTAVSANDGQEALSSMEDTMVQMNTATSSISSKLAVLSEKATNINTVVTTITKVADQTNLLSLNAAIEAEKAGEYGLGFAVVATEIRRLADQTAVATWDIEQMVKEMQSAVSAGVMGMDKFSEEVTRGVDDVRQIGGQLAHIIEQVQTLTPRFDAVNEGMQAQSHGAEQISEGMVQLNDATQQTVESLRESSMSINTLKDAAQELQNGVSKFRVK